MITLHMVNTYLRCVPVRVFLLFLAVICAKEIRNIWLLNTCLWQGIPCSRKGISEVSVKSDQWEVTLEKLKTQQTICPICSLDLL